jgi:hypothetical protein
MHTKSYWTTHLSHCSARGACDVLLYIECPLTVACCSTWHGLPTQYLSALATTHEYEPPLAGSLHQATLLLTRITAVATAVMITGKLVRTAVQLAAALLLLMMTVVVVVALADTEHLVLSSSL